MGECEWTLEFVKCCQTSKKLYKASNGRYYCHNHNKIINYVLNIPSFEENFPELSTSNKIKSSYNPLTSSNPEIISKPVIVTPHLAKSCDSISKPAKECSAIGCDKKETKHVYQGFFCSDHEIIIKNFRSIVDLNKKDARELEAREAEQKLRKIPHPLYQKDIDALRAHLKKKEADFINSMFKINH